MREIVAQIAFKKVKKHPDFEKNLGAGINPKAVVCEGGQMFELQTYNRWPVELTLSHRYMHGLQTATGDIKWRPKEVVDGWPMILAHVRAWIYVIFRTPYFSEIWLPVIVAFVPVVQKIYCAPWWNR